MNIFIIAPMIRSGEDVLPPEFSQYCPKDPEAPHRYILLRELSTNVHIDTDYRIWQADVDETKLAEIAALPDTLIFPNSGNDNQDAAAVHSFIKSRIPKGDFGAYQKKVKGYSARMEALLNNVSKRIK